MLNALLDFFVDDFLAALATCRGQNHVATKAKRDVFIGQFSLIRAAINAPADRSKDLLSSWSLKVIFHTCAPKRLTINTATKRP